MPPLTYCKRQELETLIARYSSRFNSTSTEQLPRPEDGLEDEGDVRTGQRLAIHSLVRRADFVDRSNETTAPSSTTEFQSSASPQTFSRVAARFVGKHTGQTIETTSTLEVAKATSHNQSNVFSEDLGNERASYDRENSGESVDGMRFAFNPWMGWSETLEGYGFTQNLDDDYF